MSAPSTVAKEKPSRRVTLSTRASFWAAAAFAVLAFAANTAASPLYRATVTAATSDDRAGLITAIYIVSYLATGIPAVLAGVHPATACTRPHSSIRLRSRSWPRPQSAAF